MNDAQHDMLIWIKTAIHVTGETPTAREIAKATQHRVSTIYQWLYRLQGQGYIELAKDGRKWKITVISTQKKVAQE